MLHHKNKILLTLNQLGFFFLLLSNWKLFKAWTRGIIFILSDIFSFCNFPSAPRFSYPASINLSYLVLFGERMEIFMAVWRSYGETFIVCSEIFEYSSFFLNTRRLRRLNNALLNRGLIFLSLCFRVSSDAMKSVVIKIYKDCFTREKIFFPSWVFGEKR